jgi:hypothetical protein
MYKSLLRDIPRLIKHRLKDVTESKNTMSELILSSLVLNVQNPNYSSAANPLRKLVEESSETNTERIERPVYIVTKSLDSCIKHLERMFKSLNRLDQPCLLISDRLLHSNTGVSASETTSMKSVRMESKGIWCTL